MCPKNETQCWFCDREFEYDGEKYRDVDCLHCGVQNSIYNPTAAVNYKPKINEKEKETDMPNVNDLNHFLTATDVTDGDILVFKNAGELVEQDFSDEKDGSDIRTVLNIEVLIPSGKTKMVSPNKTSRNSLAEVYGVDTEKWAGKKAIVEIIKQNVRGTIRKVIYLKPAPIQA